MWHHNAPIKSRSKWVLMQEKSVCGITLSKKHVFVNRLTSEWRNWTTVLVMERRKNVRPQTKNLGGSRRSVRRWILNERGRPHGPCKDSKANVNKNLLPEAFKASSVTSDGRWCLINGLRFLISTSEFYVNSTLWFLHIDDAFSIFFYFKGIT